jgi:hypothetical protein
MPLRVDGSGLRSAALALVSGTILAVLAWAASRRALGKDADDEEEDGVDKAEECDEVEQQMPVIAEPSHGVRKSQQADTTESIPPKDFRADGDANAGAVVSAASSAPWNNMAWPFATSPLATAQQRGATMPWAAGGNTASPGRQGAMSASEKRDLDLMFRHQGRHEGKSIGTDLNKAKQAKQAKQARDRKQARSRILEPTEEADDEGAADATGDGEAAASCAADGDNTTKELDLELERDETHEAISHPSPRNPKKAKRRPKKLKATVVVTEIDADTSSVHPTGDEEGVTSSVNIEARTEEDVPANEEAPPAIAESLPVATASEDAVALAEVVPTQVESCADHAVALSGVATPVEACADHAAALSEAVPTPVESCADIAAGFAEVVPTQVESCVDHAEPDAHEASSCSGHVLTPTETTTSRQDSECTEDSGLTGRAALPSSPDTRRRAWADLTDTSDSDSYVGVRVPEPSPALAAILRCDVGQLVPISILERQRMKPVGAKAAAPVTKATEKVVNGHTEAEDTKAQVSLSHSSHAATPPERQKRMKLTSAKAPPRAKAEAKVVDGPVEVTMNVTNGHAAPPLDDGWVTVPTRKARPGRACA